MREKNYLIKKYGEAYIPLLQAADLGHVLASTYIGYMYDMGLGIKQDDIQPMQWYRKADRQGEVWSKFRLKIIYDITEY